MTRVLSVEEYRAELAKGKPSKYGSHALVYEGVRYHSKAELRFEMRLRLLRAAGRVAWWVRQVPFALPGDEKTIRAKKYLLDFLVVLDTGLTRLIDVKGFQTQNSATKISVVQATHHVTIELVRPDEVESWG